MASTDRLKRYSWSKQPIPQIAVGLNSKQDKQVSVKAESVAESIPKETMKDRVPLPSDPLLDIHLLKNESFE